jgi:SOS-response transcriptional repressor LexA
LETSPQYINQVAKGICSLSDEKYEKLVQGQWDISMLNIPPYIKIPATMTVYEDATVKADDDTEISVVPASVVEEAKAEAIEEYKAEESVPIIPAEVANIATVDVRKYIEDNIDELERFHFGKRAKVSSGVECVFDNSMAPTFIPSDKVLISFIDDISTIIDGDIHYIQLENRPTMLRKVKIEGDKLRLIAENPNYGDIVVAHNNVVNIASVVCMVRTSFGNQNAEIESLRRKKDSQIDKLIKQNGDALKSIGDLISVIKNK